MEIKIRPLFFALFLLSLVANFWSNHGLPQKKVLNLKAFQWKHSTSLHSYVFQKSRTQNGVVLLEMKHRDSCSDDRKITSPDHWNKNSEKRIILDDIHVRSLQSQINRTLSSSVLLDSSETRIPLISGIKLEILNYIVSVELGGRSMSVIVDTGSDLTWVQCEPCKSCYDQKGPLFDPSRSHAFRTVPCDSAACRSLRFATGNSGVCVATNGSSDACEYIVSYGDGSHTRGELARDTLALGTASVLGGFVFGCGRDNKGLFGGVSGLMGLGRSDLSFTSQSSTIFGGVFSYCLPSTEPGATGSLTMGFDASALTTNISYTKMLPNPTFYFLNLTAISVGDVTVNAPSTILIDSGTVITRLPPSIYTAVKTEFAKQFSGFALAPGFSILDTCFDLSGYEEVSVPAMTMRFDGGAELDVDVAGMLYVVKNDASQVCLALASLSYEYETGIIGNFQQRNQRVVYDTREARLGFAGEACGFDP